MSNIPFDTHGFEKRGKGLSDHWAAALSVFHLFLCQKVGLPHMKMRLRLISTYTEKIVKKATLLRDQGARVHLLDLQEKQSGYANWGQLI